MDCPVCKNSKLVMSERLGIEIDYCPNCRGVWLDRGELDKIIDRSVGDNVQTIPRHEEVRRSDDHYQHGYRKKKREGFLGDLFDF